VQLDHVDLVTYQLAYDDYIFKIWKLMFMQPLTQFKWCLWETNTTNLSADLVLICLKINSDISDKGWLYTILHMAYKWLGSSYVNDIFDHTIWSLLQPMAVLLNLVRHSLVFTTDHGKCFIIHPFLV